MISKKKENDVTRYRVTQINRQVDLEKVFTARPIALEDISVFNAQASDRLKALAKLSAHDQHLGNFSS